MNPFIISLSNKDRQTKEARTIILSIALMALPAFAMIITGCGDEGGVGALEERVIIGPPDEPASTQILVWGVDEINAERVWGAKEAKTR